MPFVIERADGSTFVASGYLAGAAPSGARDFQPAGASKGTLPPKVDLRPYLTAVENQSQTGSCVANAVAGAYEYLFKRHHEIDNYDVSRLFVYYNARSLRGLESKDGGSFIADAIESLKQHGACSEDTWPFEIKKVNNKPHGDAYEEAGGFLIEDVLHVPTDLKTWKQVLVEGYPIVFAIRTFESFGAHRKRGLVPLPTKGEEGRKKHGNHAMLCVGYSDPDQVFIVRNSWGTDWGDGGYCYIPYSYMMSKEYNHGDSWIIRQVDAVEPDEDTWGDDTSLIEDVGTALSEMDEEAYREMLDAMGDVSLEARLAHLMLSAAGCDDEVSDDEIEAISQFLGEVFEMLGVDLTATKVLRQARRLLSREDLLEETTALFGEHLSRSALAGLITQVAAVAGVDDLADEEAEFVHALVQAWQIDESLVYEEGGEEEGDGTYSPEDAGTALSEMDEEDRAALDREAGRIPVEVRIAVVLAGLALADGDLADEEMESLIEVLGQVFEAAGIEAKPRAAARRAVELAEKDKNDALFNASVELLGRHLPAEALAALYTAAAEVVGADDISEDEEGWLAWLAEAWELDLEGEEGGEEEE